MQIYLQTFATAFSLELMELYGIFFPKVEQIQAEYRKLALELHPDKNSGDKEAEAKFQQIQVIQSNLIEKSPA